VRSKCQPEDMHLGHRTARPTTTQGTKRTSALTRRLQRSRPSGTPDGWSDPEVGHAGQSVTLPVSSGQFRSVPVSHTGRPASQLRPRLLIDPLAALGHIRSGNLGVGENHRQLLSRHSYSLWITVTQWACEQRNTNKNVKIRNLQVFHTYPLGPPLTVGRDSARGWWALPQRNRGGVARPAMCCARPGPMPPLCGPWSAPSLNSRVPDGRDPLRPIPGGVDRAPAPAFRLPQEAQERNPCRPRPRSQRSLPTSWP